MPNTSSAGKAMRQSVRKNAVNVIRKEKYKKAVKNLRKAVAKDVTKIGDSLATTFQALDKAAKGGVIKANKANRLKSRAAKAIRKASK